MADPRHEEHDAIHGMAGAISSGALRRSGGHQDDAAGAAELEEEGVRMTNEAFQEVIRVLKGAVQAGSDSVGLEYKGADLPVIYQRGQVGLGAGSIPEDLKQAVIEEIVQRAGLKRKSRGKMPVTLGGSEYEVTVKEYDSFGESAFNLMLRKARAAK